jgi:hypothetical protein
VTAIQLRPRGLSLDLPAIDNGCKGEAVAQFLSGANYARPSIVVHPRPGTGSWWQDARFISHSFHGEILGSPGKGDAADGASAPAILAAKC